LKTKHLFYLIFCFITISLFAQERKKINIDSIFKEYKKMPSSNKKVDELIWLYRKSVKQRNAKEAVIDEALSVSEALFYINGIAKCYDRKGLTARFQSNYIEAIRFHKRALSYFNKTTDSLSKLKCLNNIGVAYRKINREHDAFNYYFQALKLAEKIHSYKSIAIANNGIGNIFVDTREYEKALEYLKKGIAVTVEYNNDRNQEIGLSNIGEVFIQTQQYDSAYFYLNKALKISERTKNTEGIAIKQNLLGLLSQKKKNYTNAIGYYNKAIPNLKKYKNKRYLSNTFINKGVCLMEQKRYVTSLQHINKGLSLAKKINSVENIALAYKTLVSYYTKKNDFKKALDSHKKSTVFYDSILNIESKRSILNSQIAYESFKKDEKIQQLANEKEVNQKKSNRKFNNLFYGLIASFLMIFSLLYTRYLSKKNTDLELDNKNNEIQNYLLQINELKNSSKISKESKTEFDNYNLSKREQEIFNYIAKGLTNEEIAQAIFLSKNTVKTHIQNIYSKLDVKNRIQALKKLSTTL
jgi:ATP/maltotriose-dependent transcriptional regulator MalT